MPETVKKCPLCHYKASQDFDSRRFRGYTIHNRICVNCGLVFQSPRMNSIELDEFYESEYRQVYHGDESPSELDLLTQQGRARSLLEFVVDTIPNVNRHLDIGCSAGFLLEQIRDQFGSYPIGVEPGDAYRSYAQEKGLNIHPNLADLETSGEEKFDLVSLAHVLEHLPDPVDYLIHLREQYLFHAGWLLVEVPNLYCHDSFEIAHLVSFSSHTLHQIIQRSGYEIIKFEAHGRPRSELLPLYLTLIACPGKGIKIVQSEKGVVQKRQLGMLRRRVLQRLFPKKAWIQ